MYSERVILANLEEFATREGWCPTYHSLAEVEEFKIYMNSIIKLEENSRRSYVTVTAALTDKRKAEVRRWIENEQVLCGLDSGYWLSRYAWVCDEKGQIFKFQPRLSQQIYNSVVADFDDKQVSIELLILKGRQLGITTQTALYFLHRMLFLPHTQAIMASVKTDSSQLISRIIETAYDRCPFWLVPVLGAKKTYSNGSVMSIQSGMQATGLAQGWTPSCFSSETEIRLINGGMKKICELRSGDVIYTHRGNVVSVKEALCTRQGEIETKKIRLYGDQVVSECTPEHLLFTDRGWKNVASLNYGDYLAYPIRPIAGTRESVPLFMYKRGKISEEKKIKFDFPLSLATGYLCGLYLAEGSIKFGSKRTSHKISEFSLTVHSKEVERTVRAMRAVIGDVYTIRLSPKENLNSVIITSSCGWLARFLYEEFGRVKDKRVPDWVWGCKREFGEGLVHGWLDGDGHLEARTNKVIGVSVCAAIVYQMRDLIASLGYGWCSIYKRKGGISYWGKPMERAYNLVLLGTVGRAYRARWNFPYVSGRDFGRYWKYIDRSHIGIMVKDITSSSCSSVWDIEVSDEDHSFLTGSLAAHNCVHLSEIADIPNPVKTIEEGLFRATHSSKNLFMVLEGTGGGSTGWLADTWRTAKGDWPKGVSRLCPIFIPWPMCPEIYPQQDWIRKFPIPEGFMSKRTDATKKHVARCESYIRNTPYLAKVAGKHWQMPPEQQWFWQFNYDQACKNHTQKTWLAQMPADDFESLTGKHDPIFDPEVIQEVEENIYEFVTIAATGQDIKTRKKPMQAYAIQGDSVDDAFIIDNSDPRIDWDKPVIEVKWKNHRGQKYKWELIPFMPIDEEVETATLDLLLVYEEPQSGADYSCGVDTADGLDQPDEERACASMTRNMFGSAFDYQVAELTSKRMNPAQMTAFVAAMAAWYGERAKDWRGVKFAIEQIRGPGDTCQNQLKIMGFNFHHKPRRYDSKKVKDESRNKEGWYSTVWSVPILMTHFVEAVNGGWYQPKSKWLVEELKTLERHVTSGKSKMEHRAGQFDDRVRAAAMSYFTTHDLDDLAERAQKRYAQPIKKKTSAEEGVCRSNIISVGDWE